MSKNDLTEVADAGHNYLRVTKSLMDEIDAQIRIPCETEMDWAEDVEILRVRIQRCKKCYEKLSDSIFWAGVLDKLWED